MALREALEVVLQAARGLRSLHEEHKLVHQDLKPANILCFDDVHVDGVTSGLIKLADFGL
jgi:serine/threonine protein kinase